MPKRPDPRALLGPLVAAVGGFMMLLSLPVLAGADAARVGVVVPPWQTGGMARAAALGLPILDIRWSGHLIVVDLTAAPAAAGRLRAQGLLLIDATAASGCNLPPSGPA